MMTATSSSAVTNPGNDPYVPFSKAALTGTIVTDSYLAGAGGGVGTSYTATIAQQAGTGNYVQFNATVDGASGATYSFATSGSGAISTPTSAAASWVFQDTATGQTATGALAGSTVSATGTTGKTFLASTVTGTVAVPSTSVANLAILYGVSGGTVTAANWAPWGAGNNAILYTVTVGMDTKKLYVALGGFANSIGWVNASFRVTVPSTGLTTLTVTENIVGGSGVNVSTVREIISINGIGAAPANTYSFTNVSSVEGTSGYQPNAGKTIYAPASDVVSDAAVISFEAFGTNGTAITNPLLQPNLTVTITGVGSLSPSFPASLQYLLVPAQTWTSSAVAVYSDGRPGTATVTVKAGDVVAGVVTVVFYGKVSKIEATPIYTIGYADGAGATTGSLAGTLNANSYFGIAAGEWFAPDAVNNDVAIAILATDSNGNAVPVDPDMYTVTNTNPTGFSLDLANAIVDNGIGLGSVAFGITHATFDTTAFTKSGDKATFKVSYLNSDATVVTSNDINLTAGGAPATVTITSNKEVYTPGERGSLTTVVRDAAGNKVADSQFWTNFYAATPSVSGAFTWTTSAGATVPAYSKGQFTVDGQWTSSFFAPIASGTYTIKATTGSDFVAAGRGVAKEVTIKVSPDAGSLAAQAAAEAAADAAAEAIDAANAATDAANLAAEAADAATAAVEELATQVAALMAALKAQITTLANTVAKIAKKIKA